MTTAPSPLPPTRWAVAGAVAGLTGAVGIQASLAIDAVYHPDVAGDAGRIAERLDELVPRLLVMHVALRGVAFTTEVVFGLTGDEVEMDPEFAAVVGHWTATVPWLWVGAGVTGLATLVGISPLQYLAGFTGPVLVLALGAGFALGDRSERQSRA